MKLSLKDPWPTYTTFLRGTALLWLAVLACEFVSPFRPSVVLAASVVRVQVLYTIALAAGVVLLVAVVGALALLLAYLCGKPLRRWFGVEAASGGPVAIALAAGISSLIPDVRADYALTAVKLGVGVALLVVALPLTGRLSPRLRRWLELVAAGGFLCFWAFTMLLAVGQDVATSVIVWLAAAALLVCAIREFSERRFAPHAVKLAIASFVCVIIATDDLGVIEHAGLKSQAKLEPDTANVLLFVVDTLRADHTGIGGYALQTTPTLDDQRLNRATTFSQAWAGATSTIPSMKSLFTSSSPSRWGFQDAGKKAPPKSALTLPEAMKKRGFRTAGFTANSLIRKPGFHRGFEEFLGMGGLDILEDGFFVDQLVINDDLIRKWEISARYALHKVDGRDVVSWTRDWIEENKGEPFFLYTHLIDPHWPYRDRGYDMIPEDVRDLDTPYSYVDFKMNHHLRLLKTNPGLRELVGRYNEEIRSADEVFASMFEVLEDEGLRENTIVIFLADHGEAFFEHGVYGHGGDVHQEQAHVPLVIFWPEGFFERRFGAGMEPPSLVTAPVSLLDVFPTLAEIFDLPAPKKGFAGRSLVPLLTGTSSDLVPIITESYTPKQCRAGYREGDLMARIEFSSETSPLETESVIAFDLARDPDQKQPLDLVAPTTAAFVQRARKALQGRWQQWPDRNQVEPDVLASDNPEIEQLRVLGYIE